MVKIQYCNRSINYGTVDNFNYLYYETSKSIVFIRINDNY
jgi:hypothetical protein